MRTSEAKWEGDSKGLIGRLAAGTYSTHSRFRRSEDPKGAWGTRLTRTRHGYKLGSMLIRTAHALLMYQSVMRIGSSNQKGKTLNDIGDLRGCQCDRGSRFMHVPSE
jgi:hypothetical protein